MAKSKDIGVGVLGLGMGRQVLNINNVADSRQKVIGVCDIDEGRLGVTAGEFGVGLKTTRYEELLACADIDVIGIYTPDKNHCGEILAALDAGKHVVVTKPMVNTVAEAEQVVAAVRRTGKKLLVGQTMRFIPVNIAAKQLVDSGEIGDVILVQAAYIHDMRPVLARTPWRREQYNKIWFVGSAVHPIDLIQWYAGDVAEISVFANDGGTLADRPGLNNFVANLKFKSGAIGRILSIYGIVHPPAGMDNLGICCTRGSIVGDRYTKDWPDGVKEHSLAELAAPHDHDDYRGHGGEVIRYMLHFEDCLLNDKQPLIDAVQGAKTCAVSYAGLESVETAKSVTVRTDF